MPNKFITNLDLARQAEIFSGETAVFQGGIQLGIPFSGFPSGVDTSTITSIGVVDTQFAAFSGGTGTTVFNVTDPASPYYNATATTLSVSPYTVIDNDTVTETVSATTYPTIMTFTALSGTSDAPLSISFTPSVIQEIYNRGLYGTLFDGLGLSSLGQTFIDESFYNDGSIFSGANLNMEIVEYAPHGTTPAWVTGTTSGTVIEYSALTQYWTDTTIINGVSGLTLPITPESAETKTIDYVWTLTDSTIIDENVIGLEYTGYSVTYSFNDVIVDPESPSAVGATGATSADTYYLGTVTASLENFSAGTLDYKESTNWITIDGNATVTERLTVNRMTIDNPGTGTPINNIGITVDGDVVFGTTGATVTGLTFNDTTYDLTVGLDNGLSFTDSLAILASDIKVTGGTYDGVTGEIDFVNNSGGTFVVSGLSTDFTGNTSGTCITDLHISNLHSCSPLYVNPLDEGNVYFGSTSGVTIDVANNRIGIGTETPSSQLHIAGSGASTTLKIQSEDTNNAVITIDSQTTGGSGFRNTAIQFQENSTTQWMIGMNGIAGGSEEDKQFVIANNTSFDTDNVVNINPSNGYVGIGVQAPTEALDISGNTKISGTINVGQNNTISTASTASSIVGGEDNKITGGTKYDGVFGGRGNVVNGSVSESSVIVAGESNTATDAYFGAIVGGTLNTMNNNSRSVIIGGLNNTNNSDQGAIIAGDDNTIDTTSNKSAIIAGEENDITSSSSFSVIAGGWYNTFNTNSTEGFIGGGSGNTIDNGSDRSGMLGGKGLLINASEDSIIAGGSENTLTQSNYSAIIGGTDNTLNAAGDDRSAIIAGSGNTITNGSNESNVIIAGIGNTLKAGDGSTIVGGSNNLIQFGNDSCSIVGGSNNLMNASNNSVIIGGQSITGTNSDTVYVPNLNIGGGITTSLLTLQSFDDDSAAGTGGLSAGEVYQTTGAGAAPLNAAGILMVKQ